MSSILKVNTINEVTSANGVTVDGLNIKDSKLVTANSIVTDNITAANVTKDKTSFITTSSSPGLEIKGDGTTDGTIQLNCSQNSHGVKIKGPPHSASASYTLTLPNNDGDANQFLQSNGSGVLSFAAAGGVAGITSSANATAMTITSAEKIGIGTGSPVTTLDVGGSLSGGQGVVGKEMLVSQTLNTAYNGSNSGSWGGLMLNNNNSSTSVRTATGLHFTHGTSGVAGIVSTSTTSQRADIRFITRGAGDAVADRVIIHDDGVMSASQGIALGVGTANTASNVLDDYEEGTWTPTFDSGELNGFSGSATVNDSVYTKIGNLCHIFTRISFGSSSGNLAVGDKIVINPSSLPFTRIQTDGQGTGSAVFHYNASGNGLASVTASGSDLRIFVHNVIGSPTRTSTAFIAFTYQTN